jgi:serine kinase of HPr protein (carbohydrate metabolism regulator)
MILLHASCVAIDSRGVLIRGPSGAGKSDLALRLIDEGAALVADDYCEVIAADGVLYAQAPALIAGKMEVRGHGIVALPHRQRAPVAAVIDLAPWQKIERLPEQTTCVVAGVALPWVQIDPQTVSAAARVRLAVRLAGDASAATAAAR